MNARHALAHGETKRAVRRGLCHGLPGVMLRKGDPKSRISTPMGPGGVRRGSGGGVPSARFLLLRYPRVYTGQDLCQTQWGRAPLPMVRERRGVHPTVIGNPPLHPQRRRPTPHTFGPLSLFRLLVLSCTPMRAPTGSRPLSMRSTKHTTRQQECAYRRSV
jgi:hypothetical protein